MNRLISRIGAAIVAVTVFLFALFLIVDFSFGSFFVCIFLAIGYALTAAGLAHEAPAERRVAAIAGLFFAGIYAVLIFLVYFAQTTSVRTDDLSEAARQVLDFRRGGLIFNYDLLGYGMMALSTFFIGLSMKARSRADRWLKGLMMLHGVFFFGCLILPMTGVFSGMGDGETSRGGVIALVCWCVYFFPVGILAWRHFHDKT